MQARTMRLAAAGLLAGWMLYSSAEAPGYAKIRPDIVYKSAPTYSTVVIIDPEYER